MPQKVTPAPTVPKHKAVIFLFLTGGLSQHDSFDMKPEGPAEYKGEFNPIATRTPGIQICEQLPMLAARSDRWALVRSLTHNNNDHNAIAEPHTPEVFASTIYHALGIPHDADRHDALWDDHIQSGVRCVQSGS